MIIKNADDKSAVIAELEQYISHPRIPDEIKRKIEKERNNLSSGAKNERDSAYFLYPRFGAGKNWMVLHDLRIEEAGQVAQIDHLLINRFLEFYVLESKSFGNGIAINEHGEFTTWIGNRPVGTPSPIEQNRRHIVVLDNLLHALPMPKRLGIRLSPTLKSFVLVSNESNITRPPKAKFNTDEVVKAEAFATLVDKEIDGRSGATILTNAAKLVASETIETIARLLLLEHRPIAINYVGKFGIAQYLVGDLKDPPNALPQQSAGPKCPKCGGDMVKRKASKGTNAGNFFWGCSTYPKCRSIVAFEEGRL